MNRRDRRAGKTEPPATTEAASSDRPPQPTYEELKQRVADLQKHANDGELEFRIGNKGGVSVYGLGRFPVTLYYEQWVMLLDKAAELRQFVEKAARGGKLTMKGDKR